MTVYEWETGTFPGIRLHSLAFPCAHCEDPSCVKACKQGAIYKEDEFGAVLVDQDKCIGCRACVRAIGCPAIVGAEGKKVKIDESLCYGCKLCAPICPVGAIGGTEDA